MRLRSLPDAPDARVIGFPAERRAAAPDVAALADPSAPLATAAAGLRAALGAARTPDGAPVRLAAMIGVDAADDTPALALALAVASAAAGEATLLVDADLAAPCLHAKLGLPLAPGLAGLTPGERTGVAATGVPDLMLLPAGARDDATSVFDRAGVFARLRPLVDRFAATIVLAPADADRAVAVAEGFDAAILVVRRDISSARTVAALSRRLAARGTPVLATACLERTR